MVGRGFRVAAILLGGAVAGADAGSAETFHKLGGVQIKERFAGMDVTDNVHWRDRYERNGTLTSHAMGRKSSGTWRIERGELCLERNADDRGCYEVWVLGRNVEMRRPGLDAPILEGVLQRPAKGRAQ